MYSIEQRLVTAFAAHGFTCVKQQTRNLTYQVQGFTPDKITQVLDAAGYRLQQGDFPNPDNDGCYYVERRCVLAAIAPDEDTGTYYIEFGGY